MSNRFEFMANITLTERELDAVRRFTSYQETKTEDPIDGDTSLTMEVMKRIVENAQPIPPYSCT